MQDGGQRRTPRDVIAVLTHQEPIDVTIERVYCGEYCGSTVIGEVRVFWSYAECKKTLFFYGCTDPAWRHHLDAITQATTHALAYWLENPEDLQIRFRFR